MWLNLSDLRQIDKVVLSCDWLCHNPQRSGGIFRKVGGK